MISNEELEKVKTAEEALKLFEAKAYELVQDIIDIHNKLGAENEEEVGKFYNLIEANPDLNRLNDVLNDLEANG